MSSSDLDLSPLGIRVPHVLRNLPPSRLVEEAIRHDGCLLADSGAVVARSGAKTGRSPKDKRIQHTPGMTDDVWWGPVNVQMRKESFAACRARAIEHLNHAPRLYVIDGYAGWDADYRLKLRVICSRAYHALFMHNMLIRPTAGELAAFDPPDFVIWNAGGETADQGLPDVSSQTSVSLDFESGQMVILGTEYAGEMKKGVFTLMNYLMPRRGVLSMHCAANEGLEGDTTLFFGLSGTGKTTLSADPHRRLIGDDEHCWTERGVFNIEGGCYAKCLGLSEEREPQIFRALRFGTVLENVVLDPKTRSVDFADRSLTENTRASYPIEFIPAVKLPCLGGHPRNILLLTCDAFGVLPPVSKLTRAQAMYHFVSGYTAKVAGTEMGVAAPEATFSACFGAAFLVHHPIRYGELLAEKLDAHASQVWLVNTGWTGGGYGQGQRISLVHTRALIDAIHTGELGRMAVEVEPAFGLATPREAPGVPSSILRPRSAWRDAAEYDRAAEKLATLFHQNFAQYADEASDATLAAGPRLGRPAAAL